MAIAKINNLALAGVAKVNNLAKVSIAKINTLANVLFADSNGVSKSTSTGTGQAVYIEESEAFSFIQSDAFSIGFWIKAGWTNSLNTNIHFFAMNDGSSTGRNMQIRIFYTESNNRLEFRIGSDSSNRSLNFWALHSNLSETGLDGSAASQYWSSSNRGDVNADNFTHIVITKGTGTTLAASNIAAYWNSQQLGNAFYASGSNTGTPNMSTAARRIAVGSNAHTLQKCGDTAETVYNDLTIYNSELSSSDVTALYNNGTPTDATKLNTSTNLVGYYQFESDGSDTSGNSNETFAINGDSNIQSI